jgi:ferritin-like metal-binding protein YciE
MIRNVEEKFLAFLSGIRLAEERLLEAQQSMVEQASDESLRRGLQAHIEETRGQIENLQQVFDLLENKVQTVPSQAIDGLIAEGTEMMLMAGGYPALRDCVIADLQGKIEHFEIACYRELIMGAQALGQDAAVDLLEQNLEQEEKTARFIESATPQLLQKALQESPPGRLRDADHAPNRIEATATGENLDETTVRAESEADTEQSGLLRP